LCSPYQSGPGSTNVRDTANLATGTVDLLLPSVITNITINSIGYSTSPTSGGYNNAGPIPAADAAAFLTGGRQRDPIFQLVTG
jgi:hypothetical protein